MSLSKNVIKKIEKIFLLLSFVSLNAMALTASVDETCLDHGKSLSIINEQVIKWKASTSIAFLGRARIEGTVDQVFPDHSGHRHFSLKIVSPHEANIFIDGE